MANLDLSAGVGSFLDSINSLAESERKGAVVPFESISLPKKQPRRYFDAERLNDLKASIQQYGLLEPLVVRILEEGKYELVAGERRYRAIKELGWTEVPANILKLDDNEALQVALIENLQREDLNPVEETLGILRLLSIQLSINEDEVKSLLYRIDNTKKDLTHNVVSREVEIAKDLFARIGKISLGGFVKHRLTLLTLPSELLDALENGQIEYTKAIEISKLKDPDLRTALLDEAIANSYPISVIREKVKQIKEAQSNSTKERTVADSCQARLKEIQNRMKKSKNSIDSSKMRKIEQFLNKIEELL
ncbi:ParB/RepB/Spo0J family partition protein [Aetokthonos hydrillicola Thurmond2011]|jgi:ParB family chromosome partitioning protein|uniref:ParB/RepB/Spo0J family partition protein n=1 Tax=Aetokthonos hydrillicola Thurmond2011 TaxID=2712845 RepID=A0AAP5ICA2_9CYAN|nr:ParB/RepB/Spo0J family partition protein [Aetokthonos hydrillicola]MBW4589691.1 ParB/RepB/Spo0J family partition protein [Aetokthonos hydrillicola CCALA 1050]MDR9898945.1 ParB/RepB/Spo0J family partition protein [Aetokthonos hydrillicola Thurmond2011]